MDRSQANVACADSASSVVFEVIEKGADNSDVKVGEIQVCRCDSAALCGELQQKAQAVAVGRDGVTAGISLTAETFNKECLQRRRDRAHDRAPDVLSSSSAARPSNSGVADRYQ